MNLGFISFTIISSFGVLLHRVPVKKAAQLKEGLGSWTWKYRKDLWAKLLEKDVKN